MPIVRKVVSKLLRQRPAWLVIPATGDVEDRTTAIIGTKVLRYYWRYLDMDRLMVELGTWMSTCGNAFARVYWDPDKGPELDLSPEDIMMLPPDLQKTALQGVNLGDPCVEIVTPFEIDPDPDATRAQDWRYLVHSKIRDIEDLKDKYGTKAGDLKADGSESDSLSRYFERKIQSIAGPGIFTGTRNRDEDENHCIEHQLWVNPSKKYPNGKYIVVAGGNVLFSGDLPNKFKKIPYVHIQEIPVPGRFWGTGAMEQCLPLQADYNRGRSQLLECRNLMTKPKWLVPLNAGIKQSSLTSEPGEVIEYLAPFKPEAWTPPPIPDYVNKLLEYALKDMEDVSAIHEVTQARAPSGVRSGVAIAQLQEQDDQMLAPTFMNFENALSRMGSWLLSLVANNVTEERMIRLSGKDDEIDAMTFLGSDLIGGKSDPGVNYFDVETQMGSQLPLSKAAKTQYIIDLVNNGILDRVNDRKKIFDVLELGADEPLIGDDNLDRQNSKLENAQLRAGYPIGINPWDNDLIHIEEHRREEKTPEFLKTAQPETVANFEAHISEHTMRAYPPPPPPVEGPVEEQQETPPEEAPPWAPEDVAMQMAQGGQ
jgi:hypothetical protein